MVYTGHVKNGAIVLDEPVTLPEGVAVRIELAETTDTADEESGPSFTERYAQFIGKAEGLPEDAAENHDHYLYGTPKR
jgi:hypothetical protein